MLNIGGCGVCLNNHIPLCDLSQHAVDKLEVPPL